MRIFIIFQHIDFFALFNLQQCLFSLLAQNTINVKDIKIFDLTNNPEHNKLIKKHFHYIDIEDVTDLNSLLLNICKSLNLNDQLLVVNSNVLLQRTDWIEQIQNILDKEDSIVIPQSTIYLNKNFDLNHLIENIDIVDKDNIANLKLYALSIKTIVNIMYSNASYNTHMLNHPIYHLHIDE
jgi:hypothetical protein